MLEITLLHAKADGGAATMTAFQFENDALQSFLTEAQANETGVAFASIRALGVPLTVTADMPKAKARSENVHKSDAAKGKSAAEAKAADTRLNEPVTRTAGPGTVRSELPVKPSTERK